MESPVRDPRLEALRTALTARPTQAAAREPHLREAAVALVVRPRSQLEVLLIKRAEHERDPWSGHMALPGGRRSSGDTDLVATAMRETMEETGVKLARDGVLLGALDEVAPASPRLPPLVVSPFVMAVAPATPAKPDGVEVDATLWVPLDALREPAAVSELLLELADGPRRFPSLRYGEHVIWGLTHRILTQFLELAESVGL